MSLLRTSGEANRTQTTRNESGGGETLGGDEGALRCMNGHQTRQTSRHLPHKDNGASQNLWPREAGGGGGGALGNS